MINPLWAEDRSLETPVPGRLYTSALRINAVEENATRIILGIMAALVCYSFLLPGVAMAVLGLGWLIRGREMPYAGFRDEALDYHFIEGMIASHLALASMIIITMVVVRYLHLFHPKWLCSVQPGFRWRYLILVSVAAAIMLNAVYWVSRIGVPFEVHIDQQTVWWLIVIVVFSPLQAAGEEFLFRGYLTQAIGAFSPSPVLAVTLSALVFALMHGTQDLPLFVDRLAFGLLAGVLVVLTGGIEAAIAIHAVNNVFAFGYAAIGGGLAEVHAQRTSSWATTGWNVGAYLLAVVAAVGIGRWLNVARRSPDLSKGAAIG